MNKAIDVRGIPTDLWPRTIENFPLTERQLKDILEKQSRDIIPPAYSGTGLYLSRHLVGRTVTIGTTATLLVKESYTYPCLILNPSTSVGLTTTQNVYSGTVSAAGNSQTSSLGVAGYENAHFVLNISTITGTWDIYAQIYDSLNAVWADSQTIFSGLTATGVSYASVGVFGIGTDLAIRWNPTAAGAMTFTLSAILKGGLGGSASGLARVAFLGGPGVTTVSGYPLLEGKEQTFIIGENVELWGVSTESINLRIFSL